MLCTDPDERITIQGVLTALDCDPNDISTSFQDAGAYEALVDLPVDRAPSPVAAPKPRTASGNRFDTKFYFRHLTVSFGHQYEYLLHQKPVIF